MTFLRVDIDQLTRFARALDSSLLSLREARSALDHVRADQLGTADLDAACDGFQERWAYGTRELAKRVKTVRQGVDTSAVEHAELDAAIRAAFLKAGGGRT
ncbi:MULTISPECIES: hypothetical protein [unclassified Streptomyces]|uniref:hypothetical protein n=1 Tax=unclassified Streptomyces TaxID=2593676 RepID=UPI001BECC795|nr:MULTISPECIES: hypothetical protein [unclassified Streptomyces]MBT2407368.1 hypothetical protein [Streptomyces sp. ISL-21]MBT2455441.1 hypothetical protein [Streptomyces sp. ISL-86]MBT2611047.1 hypothetical protein [Streptomyces sp. ISL-87]